MGGERERGGEGVRERGSEGERERRTEGERLAQEVLHVWPEGCSRDY